MIDELRSELLDMYEVSETIPTWLAWVCRGCITISIFTIGFLLVKAVIPYV